MPVIHVCCFRLQVSCENESTTTHSTHGPYGGRVRPFYCKPNLKRIGWFVRKLWGGPKIWKLRHVTPATPQLGVVLWSLRRRGPFSMSVPNYFEAGMSICSKVIGVPKFQNWVTWPRPCALWGHFVVRTQGASVLHICTKFEADNLVPSKIMRVPKFGNWVTWPGHVHLWVVLWSIRKSGPSSMSVPNLKRNSNFVRSYN